MTIRDKRLHAYRPDLADLRLQGEVEAERFVEGRAGRIAASVADMRAAPRPDSGVNTQLLRGASVTVFEEAEGFAWVQAADDGYVGYVADSDLGPCDPAPTHKVAAPRTFVYPGPDLRLPRSGALSMGASVAIVGHAETRGTLYALLASGEAIIAAHLCPADAVAADYVAVAELLINTPYLWGGVSGFGIDCSGLVQLALRMAGRQVLRDSDMQAAGLGVPVDPGPTFGNLRRGDLVFWKGHVAIMTDAQTMIHANGHTMLVSREGLKEAIDRIGYLYGGPTGFRRP
ncbi:NlpC/P60 family protein [Mesorhizobium sp. LHD-90]|uniref:C40 family peptidase n=1 Tax=Mesorhizobium sp. LHD-90 TaxID=3071414 RepID=UPI0027E15FDD|nr:NlpC/P60 family protein [Mesorhizobium sp. LHD-90]MDQ6435774.1 NlpC/P60 family protein [Mesorhizobium sp. LHD-90]